MRMHFVLLIAILGLAVALAAQNATNSVGDAKLGRSVPAVFWQLHRYGRRA